jgi:hypothetical protein
MKQPNPRVENLPELRESIEEVLALLREQVEVDQHAALVDHLVRTSPGSFDELAPFRERFLQYLPPAQEANFRDFGNFLWKLVFADPELVDGPMESPEVSVRGDVERLLAELRYVEGICVLIDDAGSPKQPSDERLLDVVVGIGGLLGVMGDLLEQKLGRRRRRCQRPSKKETIAR